MTIKTKKIFPVDYRKEFTNKADQYISVTHWPRNNFVLLDTLASDEYYKEFGDNDEYSILLRPEEAKRLAKMLLDAVEELNDN